MDPDDQNPSLNRHYVLTTTQHADGIDIKIVVSTLMCAITGIFTGDPEQLQEKNYGITHKFNLSNFTWFQLV